MDHITWHCRVEYEDPSFAERLSSIGNGHLSNRIHDDIIDNSIFGEVFLSIVDHFISSERPYHIDIRSATYCCDMCSEGFCYLYCCSTNRSRGSVDEDLVPTLESCFSEECKCCSSSEWYHSSFRVTHIFGFDSKSIIFSHATVFGVGTECHICIPEYLITHLELGDIFSDLYYFP